MHRSASTAAYRCRKIAAPPRQEERLHGIGDQMRRIDPTVSGESAYAARARRATCSPKFEVPADEDLMDRPPHERAPAPFENEREDQPEQAHDDEGEAGVAVLERQQERGEQEYMTMRVVIPI